MLNLNKLAAIEGISEVQSATGNTYILTGEDLACRAAIFRKAVEEDWVIVGMTQEKRSLEALFKELTSKNK